MLAEALVVFSCVNSKGCEETSGRYFETHPEIREMVKVNEEKIVKFIGPTIIQVVGPVLYSATGGTGTVRLNKYFSLQVNRQNSTLTYAIGF